MLVQVKILQACLIGTLLVYPLQASAVMYCDAMGVVAVLSAKMRDKGYSPRKTLQELKKISPEVEYNSDVADLVESAYMSPAKGMTPDRFREFFIYFCRKNGFDRELQ